MVPNWLDLLHFINEIVPRAHVTGRALAAVAAAGVAAEAVVARITDLDELLGDHPVQAGVGLGDVGFGELFLFGFASGAGPAAGTRGFRCWLTIA